MEGSLREIWMKAASAMSWLDETVEGFEREVHKIAITGLSQSGKSMLFTALIVQHAVKVQLSDAEFLVGARNG